MSEYKIQTGVLYGKDNPLAKCVYCDGIKYGTCKEFADKNGLNYSTIMNWLNKNAYMPKTWYDRGLHLEGEDMSEYKVQVGILRNKYTPVYCDGIKYKTRREFAEKNNLKLSLVLSWLNKRKPMPREWYYKGLHYEGENMSVYKMSEYKIRVICDNIIFNSIKECAKYYNINKSTMEYWLKGKRTMPQEFRDKNLKYYNEEVDINE